MQLKEDLKKILMFVAVITIHLDPKTRFDKLIFDDGIYEVIPVLHGQTLIPLIFLIMEYKDRLQKLSKENWSR